MRLSDFFYDLPDRLIAQSPPERRDMSRLLTLERLTGKIAHRRFPDLKEYLASGDVLVINDSKVLPARIFGSKQRGGPVEFVLLRQVSEFCWETLVKPGKRARPGDFFVFSDKLSGTVTEIIEDGVRIIKFDYCGVFLEILSEIGRLPLPPYITEMLSDSSRYQTVYAEQTGSSAAPTAGLHFTNHLLEEIEKSGVQIAKITLHVGLGTFRPVKAENIEHHKMHSEFYTISDSAACKINAAKRDGKRVVAVGTTSCRTLESAAAEDGIVTAGSGFTDIFIYPGYEFKIIDALLTNFHLPESTLIMLVSALAGRDRVFAAYNEAIEQEYRFFSFGDAMLIY